MDVKAAYEDARLTGIQLLAAAKAALGELSRVEAIVKLLGMVNAEPDFGDQPKVINGCSDLFVEVFGEAGRHARSAVGMGSLPKPHYGRDRSHFPHQAVRNRHTKSVDAPSLYF